MVDFSSKIQGFTCISDDSKKKILAIIANLDDEKQAQIIAILEEGEIKKKALEGAHNKKVLEHVQKYMKKVDEFRRGPLRKAFKAAESTDHKSDEDEAEDLLKDL